MRGQGDGVEVEHHVRDHRTPGGADDLSDDIRERVGCRHAAEEPICQRDNGVEVRTRHRAEGEDQGDQRAGGGSGALEQLQADVVRGEPLGEDPRADHDCGQQRGTDTFRGHPAGEGRSHRLSSTAGDGRLRVAWPPPTR
jgi:hypothetical protein